MSEKRDDVKERDPIKVLLFLSIFLLILISTAAGAAVVFSLIFSPDSSVHWEYIAITAVIMLYVVFIEIASFQYHRRWMRPFYLLSAALMGAFFYMFIMTIIGALLLLFGALSGLMKDTEWFLQTLRIIVAGGVIIPVVWGLIEARFLLTRRVRVPLKYYSGKGFRIVLISDVHLGLLVARHRLGRIIRIVRRERPDMIVIAGDLLDTNPGFLGYLAPRLRELASSAPSYFVTGNHEFYHGYRESKKFLSNLGFIVLSNEMMKDKTGVTMIGVDDPSSFEGYEAYREKIREISGGAPEYTPKILIAHQPLYFRTAWENGVGLMLSGHTHAGQIFPGGLVTRIIFRDGDRGLKEKDGSYLYICSGTGTWGPPMRVGAPSELVVMDIKRKKIGAPKSPFRLR